MGYEEKRENTISIFEEMIRLCEGEQKLVKAIRNSKEYTVIYEGPVPETLKPAKCWENSCTIAIWKLPVLEAVQELYGRFPNDKIALLNIVSAMEYRGGIMRRSLDQEQCLYSCTTLYPCLNMPPLLREHFFHCEKRLPSYRDIYIYTPAVIQIKAGKNKLEIMEQKDWVSFDVISCAVPDREKKSDITEASQKGMHVVGDNMEECLENKFCSILQLAAHHGAGILVLDVLGLNVRYDSPHIVEKALQKALKQFEYCFRAVILPALPLTVS